LFVFMPDLEPETFLSMPAEDKAFCLQLAGWAIRDVNPGAVS